MCIEYVERTIEWNSSFTLLYSMSNNHKMAALSTFLNKKKNIAHFIAEKWSFEEQLCKNVF